MVNDSFLVTGGSRLSGEVAVSGAKNSVLKLMAAALLAEGTTVLDNCPRIQDVPLMIEVLRGLGCEVLWEETLGRMTITTPASPSSEANFDASVPCVCVCAWTSCGPYGEGYCGIAGR